MTTQTTLPPKTRTFQQRRAAARLNGRPNGGGYAYLALVLLIAIFPIWYAFSIASGDAKTITQRSLFIWPGENFFYNIGRVLDNSAVDFWSALLNSVVVSTTVAIAVVLFSTLSGYAFAKLNFQGRRGLLVFVIATMAVPTQLAVVPLFIAMAQLELVGTLWAVILPALTSAFGVFWMTQYLEQALPYELIEAARVDGASMIRTFWSVGLAGSAPGGRDARPVHLHHDLDELLLAVHRARQGQPHASRRPVGFVEQLLRRLLADHGRRSDLDRAAAAALHRGGSAAGRRDHVGGGEGLMSLALPAGFEWPADFLWGAATAAAQIEGAGHEDGKLDSIWDHYARIPGAVAHGDTPDRAVDHYHRMPEDVALLRELGLDSYRFSVSWARVKPADGPANPLGLDFYSRLVDELLEQGILPWLTLYHWDLPQALQELGGWANRDIAERFRDYASVVYDALGDRVTHWTTFNEPLCSSFISYAGGEHAPGLTDPAAALGALHHQHLAHGLAVQELRARGAEKLGITLNLTNAIPNDPSDPVDLDAARRIDALWNRAFLEPLLLGSYPADFVADVAAYDFESLVHDGDLATISAPIDFLGVNHYHDDNVSGHPLPEGTPHGLRPTDKPGGVAVRRLGVRHLPAARPSAHGDGLGDQPRRTARAAGAARVGVSEPSSALRDGERLGMGRCPYAGRPDPRRGASRLPRTPPGGDRCGNHRRRGRSRLLRVVAPGQLRVGLGLREAVRNRSRRLRDPRPDHQGQRARLRPNRQGITPGSRLAGRADRGRRG